MDPSMKKPWARTIGMPLPPLSEYGMARPWTSAMVTFHLSFFP